MSTVPAINKTQERTRQLSALLNRDAVIKNMRMALPTHLTAERMVRLALSAANKSPLIFECTDESIAAAVMACCEMGLELNGRDVYLIPFKDGKSGRYQLQVIPDYKGLIKLAYQSGMVAGISARAVRERDYFTYEYGSNEHLIHKPAAADQRGELTHAWAMCTLKDGGKPFVVLDRDQVMRRKSASKTAKFGGGPWSTDEESMWAKSAVRELSKFIPNSPRLDVALAQEDEQDYGSGVPTSSFLLDNRGDDVLPSLAAETAEPTKSSKVAEDIAAKRKTKISEVKGDPVAACLDRLKQTVNVAQVDLIRSEFAGVETTEDQQMQIDAYCLERREFLESNPEQGSLLQ